RQCTGGCSLPDEFHPASSSLLCIGKLATCAGQFVYLLSSLMRSVLIRCVTGLMFSGSPCVRSAITVNCGFDPLTQGHCVPSGLEGMPVRANSVQACWTTLTTSVSVSS